MLIRVLGDVSLLHPDGHVVPLRGTRQPALLAALVARAGEVVSAERLVDLLWPGRPPENPSSALHSAVFKLRVSLAEVSGRDLLETRDRGYRLAVTVDDVDALLFTELAQRAAREPAEEAVATLAADLPAARRRCAPPGRPGPRHRRGRGRRARPGPRRAGRPWS